MGNKTTIHEELGLIKTDVAVLKEKFSNMEKTLKSIDKAISGNGQPGLVQKLENNEDRLESHLMGDTKWKGEKDGSISGIKWAIGIGFTVLGLAVAILSFI